MQIMTVWAAKGLEFPVVCLPTLWRPPRQDEPVVYVDPVTGRRTFDLSGGVGLARRGRGADPVASWPPTSRPANASGCSTWP